MAIYVVQESSIVLTRYLVQADNEEDALVKDGLMYLGEKEGRATDQKVVAGPFACREDAAIEGRKFLDANE